MSDEEANTLRIQNDQLRHDAAHVLNELDRLRAERDELVAALEQIEQMGHYPADLAPDLIGDPERESKLCDRLADVANDALARIRATAPEPDHDRPPGQ